MESKQAFPGQDGWGINYPGADDRDQGSNCNSKSYCKNARTRIRRYRGVGYTACVKTGSEGETEGRRWKGSPDILWICSVCGLRPEGDARCDVVRTTAIRGLYSGWNKIWTRDKSSLCNPGNGNGHGHCKRKKTETSEAAKESKSEVPEKEVESKKGVEQ